MRTKNTLKTFLYGFFLTSIIAVLGLIKTKVLLSYLGDEYVGLYQLFYQIFLYLSLIEGGIDASVAYQLYKPINNNDEKQINKIFSGAKFYFKIVGTLIIIIGIVISFGIMFLIKETTISAWYIRICFILFVIASSANYFTSAHAILYESEQKLYKSSNCNHILSIAENIIAIIIAIIGGDLITILIAFVILSILKNIIFVLISKKDHKFIKNTKEKDMSFRKEANNLIVSKLSNVINENVDILILSSFINLSSVVVYTAYNQIISMIKQMIQRLNSAILPSLGNLLVSEAKKAKSTFEELNSLLFYIGNLLFAPLLFMFNDFIRIWYGENFVSTNVVTFMFVSVLYIIIISISLETYIKASGNFKSVKFSSLYQSIINIILSLILVKYFGIAGVLCATIFAFITGNFIHYPWIVCKKIINDKPRHYYFKCFKYIFGLLINIFICYFVSKFLVNSNLLQWFINGIILFILNFILTSIYFILTKETSFAARIKYLLLSRKIHEKNKK